MALNGATKKKGKIVVMTRDVSVGRWDGAATEGKQSDRVTSCDYDQDAITCKNTTKGGCMAARGKAVATCKISLSKQPPTQLNQLRKRLTSGEVVT